MGSWKPKEVSSRKDASAALDVADRSRKRKPENQSLDIARDY